MNKPTRCDVAPSSSSPPLRSKEPVTCNASLTSKRNVPAFTTVPFVYAFWLLITASPAPFLVNVAAPPNTESTVARVATSNTNEPAFKKPPLSEPPLRVTDATVSVNRPKSSVPPATASELLLARRSLAPIRSTPSCTFVTPVNTLLPLNITNPDVPLINPLPPASTLFTVPDSNTIAPDSKTPPASVPPINRRLPSLWLNESPVRRNSPPSTVTAPESFSSPDPASSNSPSRIVVPPVKLDAAVNVTVPEPSLSSPPVPEKSDAMVPALTSNVLLTRTPPRTSPPEFNWNRPVVCVVAPKLKSASPTATPPEASNALFTASSKVPPSTIVPPE